MSSQVSMRTETPIEVTSRSPPKQGFKLKRRLAG
jgi:hypothetical protein